MRRPTTFGKLPIGARFKFADGVLTFYKYSKDRYAFGPSGYGGTEYEASSTPVYYVRD